MIVSGLVARPSGSIDIQRVIFGILSPIFDDILSLWSNTLKPKQNGQHFEENIFKYIFRNDNFNVAISMYVSLCLTKSNFKNQIATYISSGWLWNNWYHGAEVVKYMEIYFGLFSLFPILLLDKSTFCIIKRIRLWTVVNTYTCFPRLKWNLKCHALAVDELSFEAIIEGMSGNLGT